MKLIFLDIDGVFNHHGYIEYSRVHMLQAFCPTSVQNVREIIKRTDARIVVSSTWRRNRSVVELRELFNWYDLGQYVIGKTPYIPDAIRGVEIQEYLNTYRREPVESFIIIDDDADMGDLMPHLVQCKNYSGFGEGWKREKAIAILNKQKYVQLSELPPETMFEHRGEIVNREKLERFHEYHHLIDPVRLEDRKTIVLIDAERRVAHA